MTTTTNSMQTINQLLDNFFKIPNDSMTSELGETCQVLKDLKKNESRSQWINND